MSGESSPASCKCQSCVGACTSKPGWMKPGEAEKIAAFLGISLPRLFKEKLIVDWWTNGSKRPTFTLSPAIVGKPAGTEAPYAATGQCVFLKRKRCSIHAVKPHECKRAWCGDGTMRKGSGHKECATAWRPKVHQQQITELLGRKPEEASGSIFDLMRLW